MNLKGKHVLVTGAANGIGKALVKLLVMEDADVTAWDIDGGGLDELQRKYPEIHVYKIDVTKEIEVLYGSQRLRKLDVLVNNAGIGCNGSLDKITKKSMQTLVDVNLIAPIEIVSRCLYYLKQSRGHIVNVSSGQAFFKLPSWAAYAATKSGLGTWSELLGVELARHGVTVTTVYPFMVNTGFYDGVGENAETEATKLSMELLPLYSNTPETVAKKILKAIKTRKRVEMVHPLNWVGYYLDTIPQIGYVIRRLASELLTK